MQDIERRYRNSSCESDLREKAESLDMSLNVICGMEHFQAKHLQTLSILGHIRRLSTPMESLSLSLKNALPCMPFPPRGGQAKRRGSTK